MKLDTTEAVLEWAEHDALAMDSLLGRPVREADTETAERLALAMRVLAIVEHTALDKLTTHGYTARAVLAQATQKGSSR